MTTLASRRRAVKSAEDGIALGPLPQFVGYALRRAQLAVFQDFVETMAALDVTPAQFSVLLLIAHNPGVNQAQIGEALAIKPANLAVMLNRLEARGVAQRRRGADRRARVLALTVAGATLLRRLETRAAEHERRQVARLGAAEKRRLLRLLAKLA